MNNYQGINPIIIQLVQKYASRLYTKLFCKIEQEDLEQELFLAAIKSLKTFDPKKGFIEDFLNTCLYQKSKEIVRAYSLNIRKIFFHTVPLSEVPVQDLPAQTSMKNSVRRSDALARFPKGLRRIVKKLMHISKKDLKKICNENDFRAINKIIKKDLRGEGVRKKMKNISCIETLSVRELSRLSETDLHDLSEKIAETHNWIKQLVEKFDMALVAKYSEEAKKKLHENGTDFGTCKLKKNGFVISVQMPKKVQWNQEILESIYNKIDSDIRKDIFKVNFSIDEKQFAKLGKIMTDAVSPARSTSYGKVKISINKTEEAK